MLGEELRNARSVAGMTQETLSFESGVDRTYISELENDRKSPTVETLMRLCEAMGTKASQLLAKVEAAGRGKQRKGPTRSDG